MATIGQIIDNPASGERLVVRQTAASTEGQLFSFELILAPGGHVPASHMHPLQEERFTVLEGRLRLRRGLHTVVATEGQTIAVAPCTVHRFQNAGNRSVARALVEVRPALRMEELFETIADLAREQRTLANGMPRPLDFALFLREFRNEVRVPLLPDWVVRAGSAPLIKAGERYGLDARYSWRPRIAA